MHLTLRVLAVAVLASAAACASASFAAAQVTPSTSASRAASRASTGDTVWVISNAVKADRRAQFEEFANAFWRAGSRPGALDSLSAETFRRTRTLYPTQPDSDGTYNYVFIMDPVVRGANYEIGPILERLFPAAESARLGRLLEESVARPQRQWVLVQRLPTP
jgi:hypothetical protein